MPLTIVVCMLALIEYIAFSMLVGRARGLYGVEAPATSGHELFDRYYRVHINTLEQLAVFLPAVVAFAIVISDLWAALLGLLFVVGRALYAVQYVKDPASRGPGMLLGFVANIVLVLGALGGAVVGLL